jgi:hypothetical protein
VYLQLGDKVKYVNLRIFISLYPQQQSSWWQHCWWVCIFWAIGSSYIPHLWCHPAKYGTI